MLKIKVFLLSQPSCVYILEFDNECFIIPDGVSEKKALNEELSIP